MVAARVVGTGPRCRVGSALATSLVRVRFSLRSRLLRVQWIVSGAALLADAVARLRGWRPIVFEAGHICRVGSTLVASFCQRALRLVSTAGVSVVVGVGRWLAAEMMAELRRWRLGFLQNRPHRQSRLGTCARFSQDAPHRRESGGDASYWWATLD
jgi:hypothetical protein